MKWDIESEMNSDRVSVFGEYESFFFLSSNLMRMTNVAHNNEVDRPHSEYMRMATLIHVTRNFVVSERKMIMS